MTTPEGAVKRLVTKILKDAAETWYHMPVQNGMGRPTLDYIGCCRGHFFAVETKAPGHKPTLRQEQTIEDMLAGGAAVFVIDSGECDDMRRLKRFLAFSTYS